MERNLVFVSYSHKDKDWKHEISEQLKVLEKHKILKLWCDRDIGPGKKWYDEIDRYLQSAKVAVLIISASFLSSDFVLNEELPKLLDRNEQEGMHLIPVLVSDCAWQAVPWLRDLQIRPKDGKPIAEFRKAQRQHELANIAREISDLLS